MLLPLPPSLCSDWRSFYLPGTLVVCALLLCSCRVASAQTQLPYMNAGPDSAFVQVDFAQLRLDQQIWYLSDKAGKDSLLDAGAVSARDLEAPAKAFEQYKHALSALKEQDFKSAIRSLQKAIALDTEFVSAHNALGLAYLEQHDPRARNEFQAAIQLDDKFPGPFLNLGMLALMSNDFVTADSNLEKAANLLPGDPRILTALAFAQNGAHKYSETLHTARRVHALKHRNDANVHYIAAAAAMSLHEFTMAQQELNTFLTEDPANPLSPIARKTLEQIADRNVQSIPPQLNISEVPVAPSSHSKSFPNSDHLRAQLLAVSGRADDTDCDDCNVSTDMPASSLPSDAAPAYIPSRVSPPDLFTIHKEVDEATLFFAVSQHGRLVNDLSLSDIRIEDDKKAPERILQFIPQSKLPLRLGLLIDISDSVENRFAFEKRAAVKFIEKILNSPSDLAFVAGFNNDTSVTQDFTHDAGALRQGIEKLNDRGETSLFDAIYYACWKLAAYPDQGRVARVLVVLTDGEDNSSHRSLQQGIAAAEAAGVTVYTVSTSEQVGLLYDPSQTDANKVLKVLAERSGGQAIFPGSLKALEWYLGLLGDVIRSRYLVAYKPADFVPNGKYRTVRVHAEKDGRRLHVQVRKGYYARLAENSRSSRLADAEPTDSLTHSVRPRSDASAKP